MGTDWKSAVYRKVQEEVKATGLTIERMVKLGRVSRSGYYRFAAGGETVPDPDMDLRDARSGVAQLRPAAAHGRTAPSWLDEPEARLPADARGQSTSCAAASSSSPPPLMGARSTPTWPAGF